MESKRNILFWFQGFGFWYVLDVVLGMWFLVGMVDGFSSINFQEGGSINGSINGDEAINKQ